MTENESARRALIQELVAKSANLRRLIGYLKNVADPVRGDKALHNVAVSLKNWETMIKNEEGL